MNANLTHSPSRRRPPLFLGCRAPSAASGSRAAGARVPPAPRSSAPPPPPPPPAPRPPRGPPPRLAPPLPPPAPERRFRQIQSPRHRRHGLTALPNDLDSLRLELLRERPPLAFGHDTLLPHFRAIWGVYQTGAGSEGVRRLSAGGDRSTPCCRTAGAGGAELLCLSARRLSCRPR